MHYCIFTLCTEPDYVLKMSLTWKRTQMCTHILVWFINFEFSKFSALFPAPFPVLGFGLFGFFFPLFYMGTMLTSENISMHVTYMHINVYIYTLRRQCFSPVSWWRLDLVVSVKHYRNASILTRLLIAEADSFVFNSTNPFSREISLSHYSYQH